MGNAEAAMAESRSPADNTVRLVESLRKADPIASAELCDSFGPRIHRFAAAQLRGDTQLAEEIMVLTMVDVVRQIHRFDAGRSTFSAWLYGMARRHIQRELRHRSRRKSVPAAVEVSLHSLSEQAATEDMAAALAERVDAQESVAKLRSHLSDFEMEILLLHYAHHLSVVEIGQIVGRSERAINSLLHRARQKARERLTNNEL